MHSPYILSRLADALGQPVFPSTMGEVSARGAALLALEALGIIQEAGDFLPSVGEAYNPDAERHQRFQTMLRSQKEFYRQVFSA